MEYKQALLMFICGLLAQAIKSELFTALSHVEKLVKIEDDLAYSLEQYLIEQEQKLEVLQKFAGEVRLTVYLARKDRSKYLGHPVNAFLLIKRFVQEWPEVERILSQPANGEGRFSCFVKFSSERLSPKE